MLQEKRIFGEPKPNDRACCHLITKILYLLDQGEPFTKKEATDTFFAVTKLFQSKDVSLSAGALLREGAVVRAHALVVYRLTAALTAALPPPARRAACAACAHRCNCVAWSILC